MNKYSSFSSLRMNKIPNERSRLYFLLAWFHAIIQERLRYVPLGWSKHYEFTEADLKCALDTIDIWIDLIAMGRTNLPIDKIPLDCDRQFEDGLSKKGICNFQDLFTERNLLIVSLLLNKIKSYSKKLCISLHNK